MFSGCSSLENNDFGNINTSKINNMGSMFSGCSHLTSLNLSNFNTFSVSDMSYMFSYCESLTTIELNSFNTENVLYMGHMFEKCNFTSLDLSNFETPRLYDMSSMFSQCNSLKEINIIHFTTKNVRQKKFTFSNLTKNYEGKIYCNFEYFEIDKFNDALSEGWSFVDVTKN